MFTSENIPRLQGSAPDALKIFSSLGKEAQAEWANIAHTQGFRAAYNHFGGKIEDALPVDARVLIASEVLEPEAI